VCVDGLVKALRANRVFAGLCDTRLTDAEQEINGVRTCDRQPKAAPADLATTVAQEHWSSPGRAARFAGVAAFPSESRLTNRGRLPGRPRRIADGRAAARPGPWRATRLAVGDVAAAGWRI
jgi:hypothetical protein